MKVSEDAVEAAGWVRDGMGWTKNGAYYAGWAEGGCVGQFEGDGGALAVQIDLPADLPPKVVLHLINAMADARAVMESPHGDD